MSGKNWSRREFLGASALAGLGLTMGGPGLAHAKENVMTTKPVDVLGVSADLAQAVLKELLAKGAEYADVFVEDALSTSLVWEDGLVRNAGVTYDGGVGLRAIQGDAQAFGFVQTPEEGALRTAAVEIASIGGKGAGRVTLGNVTPVKTTAGLYDGSAASVHLPLGPKVELLRRADAAARKYSPHVKRVDISLTEEIRLLGFYNSEGLQFVDPQPMLMFQVTVMAEKDGKRQRGQSSGGGRYGDSYFGMRSPEAIGEEAARLAVAMMDAKEAPSGPQVVILAPADSGVLLHEAVGHGLEGDFNRKGVSKYSGRVGTSVASSLCTVVDDGTLPYNRGSISVDDEGVASKSNTLIQDGILRGYMHDRISAKAMKVAPTGNGRRQSYRHPPMARMTNTYMLPGTSTPEEIIASTKLGVYCKTFTGGQVNITNGDFVFQVIEAYLVEDGKMTAPLKDVVIIGNGPDALGKVTMVGNDLRQSDGRWTCGKEDQRVPVGVGIPTIRVDGIVVGGTK